MFVWCLSAMAAIALAQDPNAEVEAEVDGAVEVIAPPSLEEIWASLPPEELLVQAIGFRDTGNRQAALDRLMFLNDRQPNPRLTFELGKTVELMEAYAEALPYYDDVLADPGADPGLKDAAAFRRIIVLDDLGEHRASIQQTRQLLKSREWSETDEQALILARGIAEVSMGASRKGARRIDDALTALMGTNAHPWMQSRARFALVEAMLNEARELELVGDKKAARRLQARSDLMIAAERQVVAIAELGEPEYALEGIVLLGDAYLHLYDDLLAAPPPRKLDDTQIAIYRQEVEGKAAVLTSKARAYFDQGVQFAQRVDWQGAARQALADRLEAMAEAGG
ncbi:MAG: hypothetical protein AAFV53_17325 [Myxococcota bacterium]